MATYNSEQMATYNSDTTDTTKDTTKVTQLVSENKKPRIDQTKVNDLKPIIIDRKFGRPEDFIEIFITDLNNNIIAEVPDYKNYNIDQNKQGLTEEVNIDPLDVLNENALYTGKYKLHVNIQKRKIFNTTTPPFKIKNISSTKDEIQLTSLEGNNTQLDNQSRNFITAVQNSTYFRDFTLNLGDNINLTAVNIDIDKSNPNEYLLSIKLLKPLPGNIKVGKKLTIVEDITEPIVMTFDLGTLPPVETALPIKGPNFKIDTRVNLKAPSAFKSYDDILSTSTTSSYQKLISKLDGYEIPEIDYGYIRPVDSSSIDFEKVTPSHFENFVHFGSATELLKNFEYKLKLLEIYDEQLSELYSIPGGTLGSPLNAEATSSILLKKEKLIEGFSGYEQFLYFDSGSIYSWPKSTGGEPYKLYSTTSEEAKIWLGSGDSNSSYYGGQLNSASIFDRQNPNKLFKLTPSFIGDKEENRPYEIFCDMIGQHFDPVWAHIKEYTQIRDNSHTIGISKNLVYYALQSLGIETLDQFENEDLVNYIFGKTLVPEDTSTVITAVSDTKAMSKEDMTKEIWKRLYHNAPYLLKSKGTKRGLRALINCYGIPNTILDIKEFGSSAPNRDAFKLYTYEKFTQVLTGDTVADEGKFGMFIETEWSSSHTIDLLNAITASGRTDSPKTVEFRIKPTGYQTESQHLFSLTNHISASGAVSGSDLHLLLEAYTGSDDFYLVNDKTKYGRLNLHQYTSSIARTDYFRIYNGDFWDIHLGTDGISGSNSTLKFGAYQATHLREVIYVTQSVEITEKQNAESFGNPYYGGSGIYTGTTKAFIGGIKNTTTNDIVTSSFYSNNVTSSFDLGYNGSLSELRYYFGELLSHKTLQLHALEPLLYAGNSISSSYDHLILRYPLSFELALVTPTTNIIPSSSFEWNQDPTAFGSILEGPITGGAILSSSGQFETGSAEVNYSGQPFSSSAATTFVYPPSGSTLDNSVIFTVGGIPNLNSHHPNQNIEYLNGFTFFQEDDITLLTETHHLPTPNTIGKSPVNKKVYIDSGSTDDNILSPDILSQLPITERQVPDFSNIGVFLSPQNEINEDIIYTLGTFSLDEFLGDPREETLDKYQDFIPLFNQYFKKLEKGKEKYNIWDFVRWMQFLDHTLFELIKKFTPQKSIDKAGILIEPHFLERPKFKRYHPVTNRPEYSGIIQDVTASFSKKANISGSGFINNRSQLNSSTGSAVVAYTKTTNPNDNLANCFLATSIGTGGSITSSTAVHFSASAGTDYISPITPTLIAGTQYQVLAKVENYLDTGSDSSQIGFSALDSAGASSGIPSTVGISRITDSGQIDFTFTSTGTDIKVFGGSGVHGSIKNISVRALPLRDLSRGIDTNYNTSIDVSKALSGSNVWEQGIISYKTGSNLVVNGDFSDITGNTTGSLAGGWVSGSTDLNDNNYITGSIVSGSSTLTIFRSGSAGFGIWGAYQTVTNLKPGHEYELTAKVIYNAHAATIAVGTYPNVLTQDGHQKLFTQPAVNQSAHPPEGPYTLQLRFKAELDRHDIALGARNSSSTTASFDDVTLHEILGPERDSKNQHLIKRNTLTHYGNYLNQNISQRDNTHQESIKQNKHTILIDPNTDLTKQFYMDDDAGHVNEDSIVFTDSIIYRKAYMWGNARDFNYGDTLDGGRPGLTFKTGRTYKLTYTITGYSGSGNVVPRIIADNGHRGNFSAASANGTYTEKVTIDGSNPVTLTPNRFYFEASAASPLNITASNILLEEINPTRPTEFDSSIESSAWKRSRYEGSRLTGVEINKYTAGDVTYGLNPVAEQRTTAIYFGKTITRCGENSKLVTINNHSFIDIERVMIIDKESDVITNINLKNEEFEGINGYIAKDFKDGSNFSIEILDDDISHLLKDNYKAKFNQGYLYNILKYKGGYAGTDTSLGEGINVGYITSQSATLAGATDYWDGSSTSQNFFCYGNHGTTMSSNNLELISNNFTKQIWPTEVTFGLVNFTTSSTDGYVYSKMQNVATFINSMLIPVASESGYRLFGTFNLGQPSMVADYSAKADAGIKSISTVEFDLDKYQISSSRPDLALSIHTLISASSDMKGFGRELLHPHSYLIPIMQGPHDVIKTQKDNSGITWPITDGAAHGGHAAASAGKVQITQYFGGENTFSSIYQISYLEKTNTIIADVDKQIELTEGVGEKGYILIPDTLDPYIKDNLEYYLDKSGLKENPGTKKTPLRGQ